MHRYLARVKELFTKELEKLSKLIPLRYILFVFMLLFHLWYLLTAASSGEIKMNIFSRKFSWQDLRPRSLSFATPVARIGLRIHWILFRRSVSSTFTWLSARTKRV